MRKSELPNSKFNWLRVKEFIELNLTRVTNRKYYIPEVDGLRFIAIFPVVMLHLSTWIRKSSTVEYAVPPLDDWLGYLTYKGAFGVQLFFVLSGFILGLPFARQRLLGGRKVKLSLFYKRRLLRLEPPYIIVMLGAFVAQVVVMGKSADELLKPLGLSLVYMHTWVTGHWSELNPVAWSLEVEVIFYLVAPLLAFLFFWRGNTLLRRTIFLLAIVLLCYLFVTFFPEIKAKGLHKTILTEMQYFLAGFLVADFFVNDKNGFFKKKSIAWDVIFLICMVGIHANSLYGNLYFYLFPFYLILIFFAGFKGVMLNWLMRKKVITIIGGMCYTIYLLHYPLLAFMSEFIKDIHVTDYYWVNLLVIAAIELPILMLVSSIFFMLIERPCMKSDWPQQLVAFFRKRVFRIQQSQS